MKPINLQQKLSLFEDHWHPRIIGELNGQHVKIAKLKGTFVWHKHDAEDELFFVVSGVLEMRFRDRTEVIRPGECIIVPRGVEHCPHAENEVEVMLFEPASTVNTGDSDDARRREHLDHI